MKFRVIESVALMSVALGTVLCSAAFAQAPCPVFLDGVSTGIPENAALTEISGMAASRKNPGVIWVHNDSGDGPRVYALSSDGTHLGTYDLQGALAIDYEDIALGPGPTPGVDYLYIGDIGDNARARGSIVVYRVIEPSVSLSQTPVSVTLTGVDTLPIQYPSTVYDCETLAVDPLTADLYLVTKDVNLSGDDGTSFIFHYPFPQDIGVLHTLTQVGSLDLGPGIFNRATGGDISPLGGIILLRSYTTLRAWPRACTESVADAMSKTPCILPLHAEVQGEAVAFAGDGTGYYTTSEQSGGTAQPIYFYDAVTTGETQCPKEITSSITPGFIVEGQVLVLHAPTLGLNYQFKRNGIALSDDAPRVTGAATDTLTFNPVLQSDMGLYTNAYDDGTKALVETESFAMEVQPPTALPLSWKTWAFLVLLVATVTVLTRRGILAIRH